MTPLDGVLAGLLLVQSVGIYVILGRAAAERRRLVNVIIARNPGELRMLERTEAERPAAKPTVHPLGL